MMAAVLLLVVVTAGKGKYQGAEDPSMPVKEITVQTLHHSVRVRKPRRVGIPLRRGSMGARKSEVP